MTQRHEQDDLPYRSAITTRQKAPEATPDDQDYRTLKIVQGILHDSMHSLGKDFNAFTLVDGNGRRIDPEGVVKEIQSRQIAYDILVPIVEAVDSALEKANI